MTTPLQVRTSSLSGQIVIGTAGDFALVCMFGLPGLSALVLPPPTKKPATSASSCWSCDSGRADWHPVISRMCEAILLQVVAAARGCPHQLQLEKDDIQSFSPGGFGNLGIFRVARSSVRIGRPVWVCRRRDNSNLHRHPRWSGTCLCAGLGCKLSSDWDLFVK